MQKVAKLVIVNQDNQYLLLYRNNHPLFGNDPDIPGGTLEEGERPIETMVREVYEEAGIVIAPDQVELLYEGTDFSRGRMHHSVYSVFLHEMPPVVLSWEHTAYEWVDKSIFLQKALGANDAYMHLVHKILQ